MMDFPHITSHLHEVTTYIPVTTNQIWCKSSTEAGSYVPEPEKLPLRRVPYSKPTWQSLQFGALDLFTSDTHRGDSRVGIAPNYNGFSPLERYPAHPSHTLRQLVASRSSPLASWGHSTKSTTTFPVLSNVTGVKPSPSMAGMNTKQLPFGWSTSEAKANSVAICLGQTSFEDMMFDLGLNDMTRCNWSQQDHNGPEENHHPSSTLFDLSGTSTVRTSSSVAETRPSTRRVNSDSRHVCTICFKSHTRPSRAMACENEHLGYQPFVCDGTCGEPGCCASFANKEHLQTHKLPYSKTHVACQICGKHGWRRNAGRHLRSCLNRHKPEIDDQY